MRGAARARTHASKHAPRMYVTRARTHARNHAPRHVYVYMHMQYIYMFCVDAHARTYCNVLYSSVLHYRAVCGNARIDGCRCVQPPPPPTTVLGSSVSLPRGERVHVLLIQVRGCRCGTPMSFVGHIRWSMLVFSAARTFDGPASCPDGRRLRDIPLRLLSVHLG